MKSTLLGATALVLLMAGPALAAPHDHDHGGPAAATPTAPAGGGGHHGGGGTGGSHTPPAGGATMGGTHHRGNATTNNTAPTGGATMGGTHHRGSGGTNNTPFNGGATMGGTNHGGGAGTRTHAGRGHNSAFDALRRVFNAPRHYHHGSYNRPTGWYAHRWTFGEFLPSLFFARSYWIDDYNDFGLPYPPPGTTWVRYGNDALLIDEDSGEVIQVAYGIFY